jgi:hypothetical protein
MLRTWAVLKDYRPVFLFAGKDACGFGCTYQCTQASEAKVKAAPLADLVLETCAGHHTSIPTWMIGKLIVVRLASVKRNPAYPPHRAGGFSIYKRGSAPRLIALAKMANESNTGGKTIKINLEQEQSITSSTSAMGLIRYAEKLREN